MVLIRTQSSFINDSELGTTFDPSLKDNITVCTACLVQPDGKSSRWKVGFIRKAV